MNEMSIEYINIDEIIPYENNPRNNDEAVPYVANSIKEFGFKVPIIIDENNVIVAGHTRLKAAEMLGLENVPCILADDLTEEQIKAFRLADNKVGEIATWDLSKLNIELEGIDMPMSDFGFKDISESDIEIKEDDFDFNEEEELPPPKTKRGEIYQLGDHVLMCGDSTSQNDVDKLMNGAIADLVVTDPPYNVNVSNSQGMTIENDNMQNDEFREFLIKAFSNMNLYIKEGGAFYVWYAGKEHINFETALNSADLHVRQQLIWVKNQFNLGRQDYQWQHEPCLYGWKDGAGHYFTYDRTQSTTIEDKPIDYDNLSKEQAIKMLKKVYSAQLPSTIIRENKPLVNDLHPTMKPINLIARLIKNSSEKQEIVLDLFGGSGSTLIACQQLNRKCYMMEYDPRYADAIIHRWEEFTGRKAVLIGGDLSGKNDKDDA